MITLTLLATITSVIVSYLSCYYSSEYANDLRKIVFSKILKFSNHELNDITKSSLFAVTIKNIGDIQSFLEKLLTIVILAPIIGIGGIIKSIELGTNLYWIVTLTFIVIFVLMIPVIYKFLPHLEKLGSFTPSIYKTTREILIGMPVIKTFVRQDYEKNKFNGMNEEYNYVRSQFAKYVHLLTPPSYVTYVLNDYFYSLFGSI